MPTSGPATDTRASIAFAVVASSLALAVLLGQVAVAGASPDSLATQAWLLRHAEAGEGPDPALTAAGRERAAAWHERLGAPVLERVYASDTRRARETAEAIAADAGAPVELYDPAEPAALVERLRRRNEPALVVGHSNTLNPLAIALGLGPQLADIAHDEHDRVYLLPLLPLAGAAARRGKEDGF